MIQAGICNGDQFWHETSFRTRNRAFHKRFILSIGAPNGRKSLSHRLVLEGIFWIARTGSPWRDLPGEFVEHQFERWTLAGLWEQIPRAWSESWLVPDALQMLDTTVVRAHH